MNSATPTSGTRRLTGRPDAARPVPTRRTGYVTHIGVRALDRIASKVGAELVVVASPGPMADAATAGSHQG